MHGYSCAECGHDMKKVGETNSGEKYECTMCGNTGNMKGMKSGGSVIPGL